MGTDGESPSRLRVVIADDDPVAREMVAAIIASDASLHLVAQCDDTASAVESVLEHSPDVAVLDWVMPGGGGARAAKHIVRERPHTAVVALTAQDTEEASLDMMRSGARGFLVKGSPPAQLIDTIHTAARLTGSSRPA
jgi:DNA-binding NarL/FixJ family response regulator